MWTERKFQCIALLAAQSSRKSIWNKTQVRCSDKRHVGRGVGIMISFNAVEPNESKMKALQSEIV